MAFQPTVGAELLIDDVSYHIAEHPHAPGMPYGQEGRQAVVYQLVRGRTRRALKVFKARYQVPALVSLSAQLGPFAALPGLAVCRRTVLTPQRHAALLRQYPDLTYAVLMPWVAGPTWMEVLLDQRALSSAASLILAQALAEILAELEQRRLAHCDLSGSNLLLTMLVQGARVNTGTPLSLVDVEQMYAPGIDRPEALPAGSPGYAHGTAAQGRWDALADRFTGAMLLAELLGWCDPRVREAAWGESYFDPAEMQQPGARAQLLEAVLRERWGQGVATLFTGAWDSATLADCPTFGTWLMMLPEQVLTKAVMPAAPGIRRPPARMPPLATPEVPAPPLPQGRLRAARAPGSVDTGPLAAGRRSHLAQLFDTGLTAYERGDRDQARELLGAVVQAAPGYRRKGRAAAQLLRALEHHPTGSAPGWWGMLAAGIVLLILLAIVLSGDIQSQSSASAPASATAVGGQTISVAGVPTQGTGPIQAARTVASYGLFDLAPPGPGNGQFNQPRGIAISPLDGSYYVVDTSNLRVQQFDKDGRFLQAFGSEGSGNGQFSGLNIANSRALGTGPGGVAVDAEGNVYVADTWNHRVQKFDQDGTYLKSWGSFIDLNPPPTPAPPPATTPPPDANTRFYGPRAIAIDSAGEVYVTDTGNKRVLVFDADGTPLRQIAQGPDPQSGALNSPVQLNEPIGIAIDSKNRVYVADTFNQRINVFDRAGQPLTRWAMPSGAWARNTAFLEPQLAVDSSDNIYASDPANQTIYKFSAEGKLLGSKNTSALNVTLVQPTGLVVTKNGDVIVVDTAKNGILNLGEISGP